MQNFSRVIEDLYQSHPMTELIRNNQASFRLIETEQGIIPLMVNRRSPNNTWTVSLYAAAVDYGREELEKVGGAKKVLFSRLLSVVSGLFCLADLDSLVGIFNYGLSTNLVPESVKQLDFPSLVAQLSQDYPRESLMIRSLNADYHTEFLKSLQEQGWDLLVTRQVYLIDHPEQALRSRDSKKDRKLLTDGRYVFEEVTAKSVQVAFEQAEYWYNELYLKKYSPTNVQFTGFFIQQLVLRGGMRLFLLKDSDGQTCGCLGMVQEGDVVTVPLLGYDLSRDRNEALYRRLSIFITDYCQKEGLRQHLSAGAPQFKASRGASAHLEYTAIYCQHLPVWKKWVWKIIARLTQTVYADLLQKEGL